MKKDRLKNMENWDVGILSLVIMIFLFIVWFINEYSGFHMETWGVETILSFNSYVLIIFLLSLFFLGTLLNKKPLVLIILFTFLLKIIFELPARFWMGGAFHPSFIFSVLIFSFFLLLIPTIPAGLGRLVRKYITIRRYRGMVIAILVVTALLTNYFAIHSEIIYPEFTGIEPLDWRIIDNGKGSIVFLNDHEGGINIDSIKMKFIKPLGVGECTIDNPLPTSVNSGGTKIINVSCDFLSEINAGDKYRVRIIINYTENITQKRYESSGVIWGVIE